MRKKQTRSHRDRTVPAIAPGFPMTEQVPTLALNDSRKDQLQTLDKALRQYGFFYVRHHGIDPSPQFDAAEALFRLNSDQKYAMSFDPWLDIGYVGTGTQNLDPNISTTRHGCHNDDDDDDGTVVPARQQQAPPPGDTKEQFMQTNNILITDPGNARIDPGHVFGGSRNYAVPDVPDFGEITQHYANAAYALNHRLNSLLFEALALSETQRQDLGANPFIVLKQMKYHGQISDPARGIFGT
jgi:isopenicillin N synthase-like dioxygenase